MMRGIKKRLSKTEDGADNGTNGIEKKRSPFRRKSKRSSDASDATASSSLAEEQVAEGRVSRQSGSLRLNSNASLHSERINRERGSRRLSVDDELAGDDNNNNKTTNEQPATPSRKSSVARESGSRRLLVVDDNEGDEEEKLVETSETPLASPEPVASAEAASTSHTESETRDVFFSPVQETTAQLAETKVQTTFEKEPAIDDEFHEAIEVTDDSAVVSRELNFSVAAETTATGAGDPVISENTNDTAEQSKSVNQEETQEQPVEIDQENVNSATVLSDLQSTEESTKNSTTKEQSILSEQPVAEEVQPTPIEEKETASPREVLFEQPASAAPAEKDPPTDATRDIAFDPPPSQKEARASDVTPGPKSSLVPVSSFDFDWQSMRKAVRKLTHHGTVLLTVAGVAVILVTAVNKHGKRR